MTITLVAFNSFERRVKILIFIFAMHSPFKGQSVISLPVARSLEGLRLVFFTFARDLEGLSLIFNQFPGNFKART